MATKRAGTERANDLDILSAIWILSANDENPTITYEGIRYRLGLPKDFDVKALVAGRGEMFRSGVPTRRLNEWKAEMLQGNHMPSWIRAIEDDSERDIRIKSLTAKDVFRNQFRAVRRAKAASVELIEWGLQHINRLREAASDAREERERKWSAVRIPFASMIVAVIAILASVYCQIENNRTQTELKKYEVTFSRKQEAYQGLMRSLDEAFYAGFQANSAGALDKMINVRFLYYSLEPLILKEDRAQIRTNLENFEGCCLNLYEDNAAGKLKDDKLRGQYSDSHISYRNQIRKSLFHALFEKKKRG